MLIAIQTDKPEVQPPSVRAGRSAVRLGSLRTLDSFGLPEDEPEPDTTGGGDLQVLDSEQGAEYTYHDGPYVRTIVVQTDLVVVKSDGDFQNRGVGRRSVISGSGVEPDPVFRSASGQLMTLPGGVLMKFDESWTQAEIAQFWSRHAIAKDRYQAQAYSTNAYFLSTEPGFPSLELANYLAAQDGVVYSVPNWAFEVTTP